jgi:hypothetical protein
VLGSLAAGPFEDLLAQHGEEFIERMAEFSEKYPKFREMLHSVWKSTIPEEVWERLEKIRATSS